MDNKNYTVNRNEIYVGNVCGINPERIVVFKNGLIDFEAVDLGILNKQDLEKKYDNQRFLLKRNTEQLSYNYAHHSTEPLFQRSMLFVLDENMHANDLLYNSPHYPIFNISSNSDCLKSKISLLHYTYSLEKVLEYFNYPEQLTYEDIVKVREQFFSCDFVLDNCELFGRIETFNESGLEITDSKGNHRTFNMINNDSILYPCYFQCLLKNKDKFIIESFTKLNELKWANGFVNDSFLPHEFEGPIRRLK